jgi:hypothetical protein
MVQDVGMLYSPRVTSREVIITFYQRTLLGTSANQKKTLSEVIIYNNKILYKFPRIRIYGLKKNYGLSQYLLQNNYRLIHGLFHIALVISTRPWYRPRGTISVEGWWQGQYEKGHVLIYLSHILPGQITCYCPRKMLLPRRKITRRKLCLYYTCKFGVISIKYVIICNKCSSWNRIEIVIALLKLIDKPYNIIYFFVIKIKT